MNIYVDTDTADDTPYKKTTNASPDAKRPMFRLLSVLIVIGIAGLAAVLLMNTVQAAREAAHRNSCICRLKQIGLALQNYVNKHGGYPPAYTIDADGKPLHSWRTLILPYMEEQTLYDSIDLDKPWDDPSNAEARKAVVDGYLCPSRVVGDEHNTTYLAVVGPTSCLRPGELRMPADIRDGVSKTLVVIEVDQAHAVHWMSPIDADEKLLLNLGPTSDLAHGSGMNGAFADGSASAFTTELPADELRAMISIAGGD